MPWDVFAALGGLAPSVAAVRSGAAGPSAAYVACTALGVWVACSTSVVVVVAGWASVAAETWMSSGVIPFEMAVVEGEVQSSGDSSPE